jgi:hypothetical protein
MTENEIAKQIVDAAYKIHVKFGPGLLESAYEALLAYELGKRDLRVVCQQPIRCTTSNCSPTCEWPTSDWACSSTLACHASRMGSSEWSTACQSDLCAFAWDKVLER